MSTIQGQQRAIRWQPNRPLFEPRCDNCRCAEWKTGDGRRRLECTKHRFFTLTHATCERHEPKEQAT